MRDNSKLHRKMGCEWTWQTRNRRTNVTYKQADQVKSYLDLNRIRYWKEPQTDDYCLEIPTPPCTTLPELKRYWEAYQAATTSLSLIRKSSGRTSGGGHIHVDCPHTIAGQALAKKCIAWSYINPWIGWVFNDPIDWNTKHAYNQRY